MNMLRLAAIAAVGLATHTAQAASLIDNSGFSQTGFRLGGTATQVETMAWTQTVEATNVVITAYVTGDDYGFVNAYLSSSIGASAGASLIDFSQTLVKAVPTTISFGQKYDLMPGTYYLTLYGTNTDDAANIRWGRTGSFTYASGFAAAGEYYANSSDADTSSPWMSTFTASNLDDNMFSVTGDVAAPTPMPEPATLALLGTGLAALAFARRRTRV